MKCPKCRKYQLSPRRVPSTDVMIDVCSMCKGTWFDEKEIDKYLNRPGEGKMKEILHHQFALSEKDTREFIRIIEDMICGASFEDIPEDWFFEKRFPRREQSSKGKIIRNGRSKKPFFEPMYRFKSRKEESLEIRREHEEVKNKIKQFWKLSDNVKNRVLERWPEEEM